MGCMAPADCSVCAVLLEYLHEDFPLKIQGLSVRLMLIPLKEPLSKTW